MSCKLVKNKLGKITAVNNQQGEKSTLFQQLFNVPLLTLNQAIDAYKNIYSDKLKDKVRFQNIETPSAQNREEILNQLKKTGLANNVYQLSNAEIEAKLIELGVDANVAKQVAENRTGFYSNASVALAKQPFIPITNTMKEGLSQAIPLFQKEGIGLTTAGFTYKNDVYFNTDANSETVEIHEFQHLFLDHLKTNRPEVYNKGISLIEAELKLGEKSEIKDVISFVEKTQPNLTGVAKTEEILVELLGRKGLELINEVKAKKGGIIEWLQDVWAEIKSMLGISQMSMQELMNLDLAGYARALNIDLLSGEVISQDNQSTITAFQIIGERGASRIEQYQQTLNQAKELDRQGVSTSEIEQQTGWYKNSQNQWKKFADDYVEQLSFKPDYLKNINKEVSVEEVLNDNIILQAYPEIKNLKVLFYDQTNKNIPEEAIGADGFLRAEDREGISTIFVKTGEEQGEMDKITFSHELNHYLQRVEGFAKGGNEQTTILLGMSVAKVRRGNGTIKEQLENSLLRTDLTVEDRKVVEETIKYLDTEDKKKFAFEQYLRLRGEIDSRAVGEAVRLNKIGKTYSEIFNDVLKKDNINQQDVIDIFGIERLLESRTEPQTQVVEPSPNFNGYATYKEAVLNTPFNEKIKIQIDDVVIAEITNNGDINDLIRQGIIEDRRELEPSGAITYKTSGSNLTMKIVNAQIAKEVLGGKINKAGDIRTEQKEEVEISDSFTENKKEYGENAALSILASDALAENTPTFGVGRIITEEIEIPSETVLMSKLKSLLNQLGVKTMSLEAWEKTNGQKATSNSLADIGNQIVAFADGKITEDQLSEETAHFIIEALDQEQIKPLLDLVHKTDEWKQYAQTYMEIYKDEAIVRREILGKVLKNALQRKAQETLQGQSVADRIIAFFNNLFDSIRNILTDNHRQQLDNFTNEVYEKLMAEELYNELSPEQFDGNKLVLYQVQTNDTVYQSITKLVKQTQTLDRVLDSPQKETIANIEKSLEEVDFKMQLEAVSGLASVLKKHINYLNTRGKKQGFLSVEETVVYSLTEDIGKALSGITPKLESANYSAFRKQKDKAVESAKDALSSLDDLTANLNNEKEEKFRELVTKIVEDNGLTEQQKDILLKEIRSQERNTNIFYSWFGGVIHAQNPILNMLAKRISRVTKETEVMSSRAENMFFNAWNALGFTDEQVPKLMKTWKRGKYIMSPYDFVKLEGVENKVRLDVIKKISPDVYNEYLKTEVTEDKVLEHFSNNQDEWTVKMSTDEVSDYKYLVKEAIDEVGTRLQALSEQDRNEYKKTIKDLNLSLRTKKLLQEVKDKKNKVYRESSKNKGFSEENLQQLREINTDFDLLANPYTTEGTLKDGLFLDEEGVLKSLIPKEQLDPEIRSVLEFNEYKNALRELFTNKEKNVFGGFFNQIQEIRKNSRQEDRLKNVQDFIQLNTRVFFTEDFWKNSGKNDSIVSKLREVGTKESLQTAQDIDTLNRNLKNILKKNKLYNRPSQIDFEGMSKGERREVIDLVTNLETKFREAKSILPKKEYEDIKKSFQSVVNDAYKSELNSRGIIERNESVSDAELSDKLTFIKEHVTREAMKSINRMEDRVRAFDMTKDLPKGLSITKEELLRDKNKAILDYAETKLMPYFKTLQSNKDGADKAEENVIIKMALAKSAEELEQIYNDYKTDFFIDVSPSFIFEDADTSTRLNREYKSRIEENEPLISKDYFNKEFFDYFGIDINKGFSFENSVATKNQNEYKAWKLTVEYQEQSIEYNNKKGKHNKYLLPQYRRGVFERIKQVASSLNRESIKEGLKDMFTYREDDLGQGQTAEGEVAQVAQKNSMVIPKTGLRQLESEAEITDELLYSYMLMRREAVKFNRRADAWADVEAIEYYIKGQKYGDKKGEANNTYKMATDFIKSNIYGQKETFNLETDLFGLLSKKHNIAPAINFFQNYVRNNNLAYSILTPMTSFLQGTTNFFVENLVGDRINKDAARMASYKMPKIMTEGTSEMFKVRPKSELNLLLQFMGQSTPMEGFKNTNQGKVVRNLAVSKSGYATHYLADVGIQAQTLLTLLHDYRFINGEIIDFYSWRRRNRTLTESQAKAQWKLYEDRVMYNYIKEAETKDGKKLGYLDVTQEIKNTEDWENKIQQIRDKLVIAKQDIDNQISEGDKGMVQRNAMLSWTTLHKGWLVTSMTKRFKEQHLNLFNNMMEEGTYRGTFNWIASSIREMKEKGIINSWRENFRNYDGGYKLRENNIIYDANGEILKTPLSLTGLKVLSNGRVVSRGTYKGTEDNWKNLESITITTNNKKEYIFNTENGEVKSLTKENATELMQDYFEELKFDFAKMRRISVTRAGIDFAITHILATLGILLSKMADDEDDDFVKEFVAYTGFRLASEVSSQSLAFPAQAYQFLESPTVGMSQLQNSLDVLDIFDTEEITRGTYKGYSKQQSWFLKAIPGIKEANKFYNIDRTRQSYEFYNNKQLKFTIAGQMLLED
jgi:hypothetical protein